MNKIMNSSRTLLFTLFSSLAFSCFAYAAGGKRSQKINSVDSSWKILNVRPVEGSQGYFLQVRCKDNLNELRPKKSASQTSGEQTVEGGEEYSGEGDGYERSSSARCSLSEDHLNRLTISPKIKFSISEDKSGGFRILGPFRKGSYKIQIAQGAVSESGAQLAEVFNWTAEVPARTPKVNFASNGRYIPEKNWKSIPLTYVNVDEITVEVMHVPMENMNQWLSQEDESIGPRTGNLIARQKIRLNSKQDENATTFLDLRSLVPEPQKGVYEVSVRPLLKDSNQESSESFRNVDFRRMLVTNINLIAKRQERDGSYVVHALSAESGEPIRGVLVKSVTPSGRIVGSCKTTKSGCQLPHLEKGSLDQTPASALLANYENDFTYLRFKDLKLDRSDADILGPAYSSPEIEYSAALYGDRNIYRPGETARIVGILRDGKQLAPNAGMPVVLEVRDARKRLVKSAALKTNSVGLIELSMPLDIASGTGEYSVDLIVAGKKIGNSSFHVEDFVPERLRITGGFKRENYVSTESAKLDFTAEYLFGGKAGGADFEVTCELEPALFTSPKNADFSFGVWRPDEEERRKIPLGLDSGRLTPEGRGSAQCLAPKSHARYAGMMRLVAKTAVSEAGSGRTTQKVFRTAMHPDSFYLGLKPQVSQLKTGDKTVVRGVIVGLDGAVVVQEREIDVFLYSMKAEHNWRYDPATGEYRYHRTLHPELDAKFKVKAVGGRFEIPATAQRISPAYLIRAQSGNARTEVQIEGAGSGYAWDFWESGRDKTPGPMKATWLKLDAPTEIKIGQKAKVKFLLPYRGWLLMTTESDKVLKSEWIEAKNAGTFEWEFEASEFQPNIYVSALLVKDPYLESKDSFLPERAFGVKSVKITPQDLVAQLTLSAPKKVRPKTKLSVTVNLTGGDTESFVTLAAVDEGILQLTGYSTPDPLSDLLKKRALGVDTFETVGWNFLFPSQPQTSKTGGDSAARGVGAGLPRPVKPVALWSGIVKLGRNGSTTIDFDVPSFRGELRLMAVATGRKKITSTEGRVTVSEPLVIQPTTPRFLALGDQTEIPVFLTNTTSETRKVDISLRAENFDTGDGTSAFAGNAQSPLSILGPKTQTLSLPAMKSGFVQFKVRANQPFGGARLIFKAVSAELEVSDDAEIPLTSPHPLAKLESVSKLAAGKQNLNLGAKGFVAGSEKNTVLLTSNPFAAVIAEHLDSLVHYPHGCIEQTTSSTRPLLYLPQLVSDFDPTKGEPEKIRKYVQAGIQRILSMQIPDGGFAYWPGGSEADAFGTVIATDLLLEAQKAGYDVPPERIDLAIKHLSRKLTNELMNRDPTEANQRSWYGWDVEPHLHYLLARSGKVQKARVERLLANQKDMNFEQVYLLKAALYLSGDRRYEVDLRAPTAPRVSESSYETWGYYSELRGMGLILAVQNELFPATDSALALAFAIADRMGSQRIRRWGFSTQELGWALTGLGKMIRAKSLKSAEPKLYLGGQLQKRVAAAGESEFIWRMRGAGSRPVQLELKAHDAGGSVFAFIRSEGVAQNPLTEYGNQGLELTYRMLNMKGEQIDPTKPLRLGEIVIAEITLEKSASGEQLRNVAVTYRFPAGLEIENPRIGRGKTLNWLDAESLWKADYTDIRDNRISFFGQLEEGRKVTMVAALRATLSGQFSGGFVDASAMYDARIYARIPGPQVSVIRGN